MNFTCLSIFFLILSRSFRLFLTFDSIAATLAPRTTTATTTTLLRGLATSKDNEKLPFGLNKVFELGEPDNLIATDQDRKLQENMKPLPDFIPDDLKKEMKQMGIESMDDLEEMEDKHLDGYNNLGLVPPEGSGTFASPILVPSRREQRQVGYVDPVSHAVYWFTIHNDDNTYYIKDLGLFFKMLHIPDPEAFAGAH
jgi:hypothetical protein